MSESWTKYKFSDIAIIQGGGTPKRSESSYFGEFIPWVTPTDLSPVGKVTKLGKVKESLSEIGLNKSSAKLIPAGSVLFSSRASIGKIAVTDYECATNQGFINLTPKAEIACPWFIAYLLARYTNDIKALAGKTTFLEIPKSKFKEFEVKLPPLKEQKRIVKVIRDSLSRVELIEALRKETLVEAKDIELALFHDALIDGMNKNKWSLCNLGDLAESFRYGTSAKAHTQPDGVPVLRMGNLQEGHLDLSNLKYLNLPEKEINKYKLSSGDILINRTNSLELVGKAATFNLKDNSWVYASYLVRVKVDQNQVLPEFVTAVINSSIGREFVMKTARRAIGMVNINAKEMAKFPIPLPPLQEQEKIISNLKAARYLTENLRLSLEESEIKQLGKSILQKAFEGDL